MPPIKETDNAVRGTYQSIAQLVEHIRLYGGVGGSWPPGLT